MTLPRTARARRHRPRRPGGRRGSVLVVVLALLSALMLLGFLFFTIASQERENARYFTASEKWYAAQLSPDELFDFALEQVIVGPQDDLANSALWGGRCSLLAGLVGDDLQPYNGRGVNVVDLANNGLPAVDQNQDGTADAGDADLDTVNDLLSTNVAQLVTAVPALTNLRGYFAKPDVGYSYPDLNSPFLAYLSVEPMTGTRVVIPSFHRPQYLRGLFSGPAVPAARQVAPADWYTNPLTQAYVLRPHAARNARVFDYSNGAANSGRIVDSGIPRFTEPTLTDGMDEGFWSRMTAVPVVDALDADADNDGIAEAVWLDLDHPVEETPDGTEKFIPLFGITIYDLDGLLNVNAHGNHYGTPNSLAAMPAGGAGDWFPLLSKSNEGRRRNQVNPQYAWVGSNAPNTTPATTLMPAGADYTQHQRFFGTVPTTPAQLANMEWWFVMAGRGELDAGGKVGQLFTGRYGEANRLADALAAKSADPYAYSRPGQTGSDEAAGVADGSRGSAYTDVTGQLFPPALVFPAPGHPEDNQGQGTSVAADGRTPLIDLLIGAPPAPFNAVKAVMGRVRVPLYQNHWLSPQLPAGIGSVWAYALGANFPTVTRLVTAMPLGTGLMSGDGRLVDDPGETLLDAGQARDQVTDSIFGADETAALHMSSADRSDNGIVSRIIKLAPANFDTATDAPDRRRRVTTTSSDLKSFTYADPTGTARAWEVEPVNANYPNAPTFPPRFIFPVPADGSFDIHEPFRPEARGLLASLPNMNSAAANAQVVLKQLSRKLSVNHVAAAYVGQNDGQPRFFLRPLTPHPFGLPTAAVPIPAIVDLNKNPLTEGNTRAYFGFSDQFLTVSGYSTTSIASPPAPFTPLQLQEWHARRDRQNLARDIYTLLYTFGHPNPATNTKTTGNMPIGTVYTASQLIEMAQFAVNVVDAMDPDDAITCFVFDTDLSTTGGGYTLRDDGYFDPVTTRIDRDAAVDEDGDGVPTNDNYHLIDLANGRGMVYGVEGQKLAFGEALALFAKKFETAGPGTATDHKATDWDDERHSDFTYVELQNMTPLPVTMAGGWSVVCRVTGTGASAPTSRAVTLNDPALAIQPGAAFAVGTSGDAYNTERSTPATARPPWSAASPAPIRASHFSVDLTGSPTADPGNFTDYEKIAPVTPALNFDLMDREDNPATRNTFRMTEVDFNDPTRDVRAFGSVDDDDLPTAAGSSPKAGGWFDPGTQVERDGLSVGTATFYLRRRLNLNRVAPAQDLAAFPNVTYTDAPAAPTMAQAAIEQDNPWVVVDTISVPLDVFDLKSQPVIQTAVTNVVSDQRTEPLSNVLSAPLNYAGTPYDDRNNLGVPATGGAMAFWQRHFDRPFASPADLLAVPLYGPGELTEANPAAPVASVSVQDARQTAAVNILFPEADPRANPPISPTGNFIPGARWPAFSGGNLWYRLFEFVEVPQKHGDNDGLPWFAHYGGPSQWLADAGQQQAFLRERLRLREFGKLNLNTLRHPQALAGLLDDPRVFTLMNGLPRNGTPFGQGYLPSSAAAGGQNTEVWLAPGFNSARIRDWWLATVSSRDGGYDPYSLQPGIAQKLILPGVPSAKPFLDFGSGPIDGSPIGTDFQRTLLRTILKDGSGTVPFDPEIPEDTSARRGLFELGDFNPGSLLGSNAEFSTRYRLLGKVLNHGTTRSNTYVAFMQVDFFEAIPGPNDGDHDNNDATPDVYQIGPKRADSPGYRGVFVIDRSLALELLKRRDLPPNDPALQYPGNTAYRTYSFAREPGPDQRPQPTFHWRDLIQYRRVLAQ